MKKNMGTKVLEIKNCTDCPFHVVQVDPDPDDWFCHDDVKVFCKKSNRNVTVACRPYNVKKECEIPEWCELDDKPKSKVKTKKEKPEPNICGKVWKDSSGQSQIAIYKN